MRAIVLLTFTALLCQLDSTVAFASSKSAPKTHSKLLATNSDDAAFSRRQVWKKTCQDLGAVLLSTASNPLAAYAKPDPLEPDKQKLIAGYKRLNYLLDNWEKETTDCKTKTQYSSASSACERTPLNVQNFLGYKSTDDPLFRADKTMRRLEVLVPSDLEVEYLDAMEKFNEKAEEGSGNAYTSSWGEANPGGGKDRVELFVDRAKVNVVDARDALGEVVKILGLLD